MRFLVGVVLTEIAVILAGVLLLGLISTQDYVMLRVRADEAERELHQVQEKHRILLNQIRKEGLWKRMGLPAQPWLE